MKMISRFAPSGIKLKGTFKLTVAAVSIAFTTLSSAYEQRACMQGVEIAFLQHDATLRAATSKMTNTMLALLNSDANADDAVVTHLANASDMVSSSLMSASAINTVRQAGTFRQVTQVDGLVKNLNLQAHASVKYAKTSFVKNTGALKNASLRDQAFQVSQELEKISMRISSCEK